MRRENGVWREKEEQIWIGIKHFAIIRILSRKIDTDRYSGSSQAESRRLVLAGSLDEDE